MVGINNIKTSIRNSYYPVFVAQSDDPVEAQKEIDNFLSGHITLSPWIPYDEWDAAVIPYENNVTVSSDKEDYNSAILRVSTDKITVNHADRYAKILDFAKAEFDPETKAFYIDRQLKGKKLVAVYQPLQFFQRLASVASSIQPDYLMLEAKELYFPDKLPPIEYRSIYEEDSRYSLEHQIRISLRYMPNISLPSVPKGDSSLNLPEYLSIDIGNLRDICGILDTHTMMSRDEFCKKQAAGEEIPPLVSQIDSNGEFHPAEDNVREQFLSDVMNKISLHDIGGTFVLAGNLVDIRPTDEWINKFRSVFPTEEWNARTFIETIPDSGTKSDRLAFQCIDMPIKVTILTNRVEILWLYKPGVEVSSYVEAILPRLLNTLTHFGVIAFCHMQYRICAEVSEPSVDYSGKGYHAEFIENKEGLTYNHMITLVNESRMNAFGFEESDRVWQYAVIISTPADENMLWYKPDEVISYFQDAKEKARDFIAIMKNGDPVEAFHNLMKDRK